MKFKLLSLILLQIAFLVVHGQSNKVVLFGGVKLNNVYKAPMPHPDAILGYAVGATYNHLLSETTFLTYGLMLDQKGYEVKVDIFTEEMTYQVKSIYIDLPVKFNFSLLKSKKLTIGVGPYVGYGITGEISTTFMGNTQKEDIRWGNKGGDYDNTPDHKRLDLGLSGNISYEYKKIIASIGYEVGVVDMVPKGLGGGECNNSAIVTLGYVLTK